MAGAPTALVVVEYVRIDGEEERVRTFIGTPLEFLDVVQNYNTAPLRVLQYATVTATAVHYVAWNNEG